MSSSSYTDSNDSRSSGSSMSDLSSMGSPRPHYPPQSSLISRARRSGIAKDLPRRTDTANPDVRSSEKTVRRVPNKYEKRREFSKDDPPSVRPEAYKSPHSIVKEGDQIDIWWEGDDKFYRGTVRNPRSDGKRRVEYEDGYVMYHLLKREVFTLAGRALERLLAERYPQNARNHTNSSTPVHYPGLADFLEVGHRVEIYWCRMRQWYKGFVLAKDNSGRFHIAYDDGDRQILRMEDETFRFVEECATIVHTRILEECLGD